jgi:hypothetical protein
MDHGIFSFLAEETRQYLGAMGFAEIDEIIGRVEFLRHSQLRSQAYPAFLPLAMSIPAPMAD